MKRIMQEYGMFTAAALIGITLLLLLGGMTGADSPGSRLMRRSIQKSGVYYQLAAYAPSGERGRSE